MVYSPYSHYSTSLRIKGISSLFLLLSLSIQIGLSQEKILYKEVDTTQLHLEVYYPPKIDSSQLHSAMVFFFGGGWNGGGTGQFHPHAHHFSSRGMVCFLVEYRVTSRNQTTPFESLKDAKSAMRFVRGNANKFGVDPDKIVAAGGSAGGHLAAATALISTYDDPSDDLSVSCIPNALVLFNPVIDNGPGGYGFSRIGSYYKAFSPLHNIQAGAPPTVFFLGTRDELVPVETATYYQRTMERVGSRCELFLYNKQGHGFFNYGNFRYYKKTLSASDLFLQSLGYLPTETRLRITKKFPKE
ncbi:MAG: alpha/beta hydrolase [Bacteroidota bacterium]